MSTLPTPRTDAWLKEPDQRTATSALSLARQLEHELAEAKAERDALEREVENITANYDEVCLQVKEYADATPLQVERDFKQRDEIKALAADLSRWRALAEELAGALEYCTLQLRHEVVLANIHQCRNGMLTPEAICRGGAALARFRDAANPASGAAGADQL